MGKDVGKTFDTPDAPVFTPTLEEWQDPTAYLWKIKDEGHKYGICIVQPPEGWKPPFSVPEQMTFKPIVQQIHYLQVAGLPLDLRHLFEEVNRRGGMVSDSENWDLVASQLGLDEEAAPNLLATLRQTYKKYLHAYELHLIAGKKNKIAARMAGGNRRAKKLDPELEQAKLQSAINAVQCEHCGFGGHEGVLLLCDGCSKGYHTFCLSPALEEVPSGEWFCESCTSSLGTDVCPMSSGDNRYTTSTYRAAADEKKKEFFDRDPSDISVNDVEQRYWKIVDGGNEAFQAEYGNDLPSDQFASGFPKAAGAKYTTDQWNLNNMHKQSGNLLRHLVERVSGVNVPWLYMGSCFSSFCWHMEDCYLYSINYHHIGSPKVWYGVPGKHSSDFEGVMRSKMPELFARQPDVLFHMNTMISPGLRPPFPTITTTFLPPSPHSSRLLIKHGVPVYRAVQKPGNFIITFPAAYHGGFNSGFNCAEAMNFALPDWLSYGHRCIQRYRQYKRTSVLALEQVVVDVIRTNLTPLNAPYLLDHVTRIYDEQRAELCAVCDSGTAKTQHSPDDAKDRQCCICQYDVYLSYVKCKCCPAKVVCLRCVEQLCECPPEDRTMVYRMPLSEIEDLVDTVQDMVTGTSSSDNQQDSPIQADLGADDSITPPPPITNGSVKPLVKATNSPRKRLRNGSGHERGSQARWVKYAAAWLQLAQAALDADLLDLEAAADLVMEAGPYTWRGHEMDDVRAVFTQLSEALHVTEAVRTALVVRTPASQVDQLIREVAKHKLPLYEEVNTLKEKLESSKAFSEQVSEALQDDAKLTGRALAYYLTKAHAQPVVTLVETQLRELQVQLKAWQEQAMAIINAGLRTRKEQNKRVPVAEVRRVIAAAKKLPVEPNEVPELQKGVEQAIAWEAEAEKLLAGEASLEALQEASIQGEALGIEAGKGLQNIQARLEAIMTWRDSVRGMSHKSATVAEMEERVRAARGFSSRVKVLELTRLEDCVAQARWQDKAAKLLKGTATLKECEAALDTAKEKGYTGLYVKGLMERVDTVEGFLVKVRAVMATKDRLQLSKAEKLASEAKRQELEFKEVVDLQAALDKASAWRKQLAATRQSRHESAKKVWGSPTAKAKNGSAVKAPVKGSAAEERVQEKSPLSQALKLLEVGKKLAIQVPEVAVLQGEVDQVKAFQKNAKEILAKGESIKPAVIAQLVAEASLLQYWVPEVAQVRTATEASSWGKKVERLLKHGGHLDLFHDYLTQAEEQLHLKDDHPTAKELPRLRDLVAKAQKLAKQVASALKHGAEHDALQALHEQCQALPVHLDEEVELAARLEAQRDLGQELQALLAADPVRPLAELKAMKGRVVAHKLTEPAEAIRRLKDGLTKAEEWEVDCRAAFFPHLNEDEEDSLNVEARPRKGKKRRRKSSTRPDNSLLEAALSTQGVLMKAWLDGSALQLSEGKAGRKGPRSYCFCGGKDDGEPMLCCDRCEEWFHAACLDLPDEGPVPPDDEDEDKAFYCPACSHRAGVPFDFAPRTARPDLPTVTALALRASTLRCEPPLARAVQALAAAASAWLAKAKMGRNEGPTKVVGSPKPGSASPRSKPGSPMKGGSPTKGSGWRLDEAVAMVLHAEGMALEVSIPTRTQLAEWLAESCAAQAIREGPRKGWEHVLGMCAQHSDGPQVAALRRMVEDKAERGVGGKAATSANKRVKAEKAEEAKDEGSTKKRGAPVVGKTIPKSKRLVEKGKARSRSNTVDGDFVWG